MDHLSKYEPCYLLINKEAEEVLQNLDVYIKEIVCLKKLYFKIFELIKFNLIH